MKLWQLSSITRVDAGLISRIASTQIAWKKYELLMSNYSNLVNAQDRAVLDSIVDTDFVAAVLGELRRDLYLTPDNRLRSWQLNPDDQAISVLDAFTRYGAGAVEDAFEYGSVEVT